MTERAAAGLVTAVLGPTNTGKTHLAMERLLGHASGMIGFPLRLLARENYDRIVRIKGRQRVALVTGEERIIPPHPSWFVCTVEAMPLDRAVAFVAVDEIQLCGDPERGHVFTDRLLHARGSDETMFMGSDTIRPLLTRLVPEAEIIARPRFSTLSYTGPRKVTRLPPRSAVVAFAVADVFEIAELVRRQRGGTAVVMGALSPRARNAQVALYQSGEVDYMVATDAIGMGLNMDLDHVALARLSKFDGRGPRRLTAPEIAQIAGRAGRHMNDGSFGTTAEAGPLDPELVEAVESHRFDPLAALVWRNPDLDFRSGPLLLRSLDARPPRPGLVRAGLADDQQALEALVRLPEITARATGRQRVRLLWEVCQIPDFRKVMSDHHARLLAQIFRALTDPDERLPTDWVAKHLAGLDRIDGDIDALVQRIAHIRTWTYITHRPNWIADPAHWQDRAIAIEDRLSDALHDRITQRFVDRRSAVLVRRMADTEELLASVSAAGDIMVEGEYIGRMEGFGFVPDPTAAGEILRTLMTAANRVLQGEIEARSRQLAAAPDTEIELDDRGDLVWRNAAIGRLVPGEAVLHPRIEIMPAAFLDGPARERIRRRLDQRVKTEIERTLPHLVAAPEGLSAAGRGLAFRLREGLGMLARDEAASLVQDMTLDDRRILSRRGVRFGTETIYIDRVLKRPAMTLRALLWSVAHGLPRPAPVPPAGRFSVPLADLAGTGLAAAVSFVPVGTHAIRVDRLEQLAAALRQRLKAGGITPDAALGTIVGVPESDLPGLLEALGYRRRKGSEPPAFGPRRRHRTGTPRPRRPPVAADHPFAALEGFAKLS